MKKKPLCVPMARHGTENKGQKIQILTNHFKVKVTTVNVHFLEDMTSNRNNKNSSPNRHRSPHETDKKRLQHPYQSKTFKAEISSLPQSRCRQLQILCVVKSRRTLKALIYHFKIPVTVSNLKMFKIWCSNINHLEFMKTN